jgi:hypothetical protein
VIQSKQGIIRIGLLISLPKQQGCEFLIPFSACLFESIQAFEQLADLIGFVAGNTIWNTHVYILLQLPMKKSIIHIKLMQMSAFDRSQGK